MPTFVSRHSWQPWKPGSTCRAFVITVPYVVERVTRMYAWRADSENLIKELKVNLSLAHSTSSYSTRPMPRSKPEAFSTT